jgi:hypothetical protein
MQCEAGVPPPPEPTTPSPARPSRFFRSETCIFEDVEAPDEEAVKRPLVLHFAGLECDDHTPAGHRQGMAGRTIPWHGVWMTDRLTTAEAGVEDIYFSECSDHYPLSSLQETPFEKSHKVVSVLAGPLLMGYPVRRRRCLAAGLSLRTVVWFGPESKAEVQKSFVDFVGRSLKVTGDAFLVASPAEVAAEMKLMAQQRRKKAEGLPSDLMPLLMRLFSPGVVQRYGEYLDIYNQSSAAGSAPAFLCDLEHHPNHGVKHGELFPTAMTHSTMCSLSKGRLVLTDELLASQGVDSRLEFSGGRNKSGLMEIFGHLKLSEVRYLAGNAMHIPLFAVFIYWVLSQCRRRDEIYFGIFVMPNVGVEVEGCEVEDEAVEARSQPEAKRAKNE